MKEKLIALSVVKKGNWGAIHQFLQQDPDLSSIDERLATDLMNKMDCDIITIFDDDYPDVGG